MELVFEGFKRLKILDYVASWFWIGAQYINKSNAKLALVSTNSISQGEQVDVLWKPIFGLNVNIDFAYKTFQWKNNAKYNAAVHVVIIGLAANTRKNKTIYSLIDDTWHSQSVNGISPYLVEGNNTVVQSRRTPIHGGTAMVFGSMPNDNGHLLLSLSEKESLFKKNPNYKKYIRKILGSQEFLNSQERWCLWLTDVDLNEINSLPYISERVELVRKSRLESTRKSTNILAETPHLFGEIRQPKSGNYILIPRVSSERRLYLPIGFLDSEIISSDANLIIPDGSLYEFGIITSILHNDWMRLVAGRLKSDYRYSASIVYNTFPFPDATEEQKKHIESLAEEILLARASNVGMTLAELYDPDKMPADLKQAHANLDDAVDKLYRPQGFANTEERLAHLLARYEELVAAEDQAKKKK